MNGDAQSPGRDAWTVARGEPPSGREYVVLVTDDAQLEPAFAHARQAAQPGARVRLVGRGVTLRSRWPAWVADATKALLLTELHAYLPAEKAPLVMPLAAAAEQWIRRIYDGAVPGQRAERSLWPMLVKRLFLEHFVEWPLVCGLAQRHAGDHVVVFGAKWAGVAALREQLRATGGTLVEATARQRRAPWAVAWTGWAAAVAGASVVRRAYEYLLEAPGRRRIREIRRAGVRPDVWLGVLADWPRSCRHVVEGVGGAAAQVGARVGVLLQDSLRSGLRREDDAKDARRTLFPTLQAPQLAGAITVDQCASAERLPDLARVTAGALAASARLWIRLAREGPMVRLGPMPVDLRERLDQLARSITIDVLRARESLLAATRLSERYPFVGAPIVWPHASLANVAVPDVALQQSGAVTYELVHGALAEPLDMITFERSESTVKVLWTMLEAQYLAPYAAHQQRVGGFVPRPLPSRSAARRRAPGEPIRLLLLTNYLSTPPGAPAMPFACYQPAIMNALATAVRAIDLPIDLRWRPHPSDQSDLVADAARDFALPMALSFGDRAPTLHADLAWADVLVTAVSTSIVEAASYPIPILVHELPIHEASGTLSAFADERRFRNGEELASRLACCLHALDSADALAPEAWMRRRLFGASGEPRTLGELLWPSALPAAGTGTR